MIETKLQEVDFQEEFKSLEELKKIIDKKFKNFPTERITGVIQVKSLIQISRNEISPSIEVPADYVKNL